MSVVIDGEMVWRKLNLTKIDESSPDGGKDCTERRKNDSRSVDYRFWQELPKQSLVEH